MPIGDLLAQISGGPAKPASGLQRPPAPKRKADDELRNDTSKAPRRTPPPSRPAPSQIVNRPIVAPRPLNGNSARPVSQASKPTDATSRPLKATGPPSRPPSRPSSAPPNNAVASKPGALPARPSPGPSAAPAAPKAPPKKGSFAEILARGQRAQAVMGQVGKIQHKKVEKTDRAPVRKDSRDAKDVKDRRDIKGGRDNRDTRDARDARPGAPSAGARPQGYAGSARPAQRNGLNGHSQSNNVRSGPGPAARPGKTSSKAVEEPPKKIKKSAQVSSGYSGTSRPRPGVTSKKDQMPRGGALLNPSAARSRSKGSRYDDEYDEELDDFIDYDDEEEEEPRYGYASDGSSDMEAGMDDLDIEERKAERIARQEDIEQERLEKSLKAQKEARKRQAMEGRR